MRKNESIEILSIYKKKFKKNFIYLNIYNLFLNKLKNVGEGEKKRKIIGNLFINIFRDLAKNTKWQFLAQGTLYPDLIESKSFRKSKF